MADLRIVDAPELSSSQIQDALKVPTGGYGNYAVTFLTIRDWLVNFKDVATKQDVSLKADQATTYTKIETDSLVSPKANISDVYKKTETYTKSEIDTKVGTVSGGYFKAFDTLANLQAATGMTTGQVAKVMNDPTATNNGDYYYNGTAWVKGYDSLTDSKAYTDSKVTMINQDILLKQPWLDLSKKADILLSSADFKTAALSISALSLTGTNSSTNYRVATVTKNHSTLGSRVLVLDDSAVVSSYIADSTVIKKGQETVALTGATVSGFATINWDALPDGFSASLSSSSRLYIDKSARNLYNEVSQNTAKVAEPFKTNKPIWLAPTYETAFSIASEADKKLAYAIKGIEVTGTHAYPYFVISVFAKNHVSYGNRIFVANNAGLSVMQFNELGVQRKGIQTVDLIPVGASALTAKMTIDWDSLSDGLLLNNANSALKINPTAKNLALAREIADANTSAIAQISTQSSSTFLATKPYRIAVAGSSITWGQGYLGQQSFVGIIEQNFRTKYASTLHAKDVAQTATTLTGENWYLGQAKRISGVNSFTEFTLSGDELSISIGRERGNAGAANIEVYVDDVLYDTFSTLNTLPFGTRSKSFTGNGADLKFDLEECFTYGHAVTVDGVAKTGSLNVQGAGGTIPASDDYMVTRKYNSTLNKVTHQIWFKVAPTGNININYNYGESISHMRGTLGNVAVGFTSNLESAYGDGSVSFDTTLPASVSSGIGFRQSDSRAVVTYKFDDIKSRKFKLLVKSLATGATGSTPYLDLNFVTNRMHHIMNAGIGGWMADYFIDHAIKLNTISEVINFNPDIVLLESCTNDDWQTFVAKATMTRSGLTNAQILADSSSNYFTTITGTSDNKTVTDTRLPIIAITESTIQLASSITDTGIAVGDVVTIGNYGGKVSRVAVRMIKSYNSATNTITLNRTISASDFYQCNTLSDLVGEHVIITNAPTWASQVKTLCDTVWSALPDCKFAIGTSGIPNYYHRRLFGYRELGQKIAKDYNITFVDFYNATRLYQHTQTMTTHQTITSTGASSYAVSGTAYVLGDWIVTVDGVEHKKCRITGGLSMHWASGITDPTLSNDSTLFKPYQLVFDANVPANGASIVIKKSSKLWSADYCHPNNPNGLLVFGQAASKILKDVN
jgi:hypothetical protein